MPCLICPKACTIQRLTVCDVGDVRNSDMAGATRLQREIRGWAGYGVSVSGLRDIKQRVAVELVKPLICSEYEILKVLQLREFRPWRRYPMG